MFANNIMNIDEGIEDYHYSQGQSESQENHSSIEILNSSTNETNKKGKEKNGLNREDNLLRKIQLHFFNYIIMFINSFLENQNYEQKFLKLTHDYKKNVNKSFIDSLKKSSLKDIIINNISEKYKNYDSNQNEILYEQIKDNPIIKKILYINYVHIFRIYFDSNRLIDLNQFGIQKTITLLNEAKTFKDLLSKNKSKGQLHLNLLKNCAIKNFLPTHKFLLEEG